MSAEFERIHPSQLTVEEIFKQKPDYEFLERVKKAEEEKARKFRENNKQKKETKLCSKQISMKEILESDKTSVVVSQNRLENALQQLELLHSTNDDRCFITLARKFRNNWTQYHIKYQEVTEKKIVNLLGLSNVYLSHNTFYKPRRGMDTLRFLKSLYVDLDFYKLDKYANTNPEKMIEILEREVFAKVDIPKASYYMSSGRGLALVWLLEPAPSQLAPLWSIMEQFLLKAFMPFGADSASTDVSRVMRLVGTKNSKSSRVTKLFVDGQASTYRLGDLADQYLPPLDINENKKTKKKLKNVEKKLVTLFNLHNLHSKRLEDLRIIQNLKNEEGKTNGFREMMCFLYRYWTCCFIKDVDIALQETLEFNQGFLVPLSDKEVINLTRSAETAYGNWLKAFENGNLHKWFKAGDKDRFYKYSNARLIKELDITKENQKHLKTIISKEERDKDYNEKRKERRRNEEGLTIREQQKQENIEKVKEFLEKDYKKTQIAKELKISRTHVYNLIEEIQKV